jgi:hypothetical protein
VEDSRACGGTGEVNAAGYRSTVVSGAFIEAAPAHGLSCQGNAAA